MYMKIGIIGAGKVGAMVTYTLLDRKLINEISIIDIRKEYLEGLKLDLQSAFPFSKIYTNTKIKDIDILVITAGFPRTANMKREDLYKKNKQVLDDIFKNKELKKHVKIIVVTNPSKELAVHLRNKLNLDETAIIDFGNELDSNRLKYLSQNKDVYVYGGHGEGMKVADGFEKYEKDVKEYALKIIKSTGGTVFGPAEHISNLIERLINN